METTNEHAEKFSQSITFKAMIIGTLTLLMLIPGAMIQNLISERKDRSVQTIEKINSQWSKSQTLKGPVLVVPYTVTATAESGKVTVENHQLKIAPEELNIQASLLPMEKYYGIYKAILYKSVLNIQGKFNRIDTQKLANADIRWADAFVVIGISDLRGVTNNIDFVLNNMHFTAISGGTAEDSVGTGLIINLNNSPLLQSDKALPFKCQLNLNGSSNINFVPMGKTTTVDMSGSWASPGFSGNFSPEHHITDKGFNAKWTILHFNRNIPESWVDNRTESFDASTFGVNLVDTVDQYQQNMRSAKYAIMFIVLTFVVFFFVEILTKTRIHPVQYLLVGLALLLFYTLLLSISEQTGFALAYVISSIATIGLIGIYVHGIFKNKMQTTVLTTILCLLYLFLYVVLQLEDVALLIGSIGLFIVLGIIMFFSKRINWYRNEE